MPPACSRPRPAGFPAVLGLLVLLILGLAAPFGGAAAQVLEGRARVVDGDTLHVAGETIRLHGIDAPEGRQSCTAADGRAWACGTWATQELRALAGGSVRCTGVERDGYGRLVARCTGAQGDLGAAMVARGAAVAYLRYAQDYIDEEKQASLAQRGLWAGAFERPETWRAQARLVRQEAPQAGCTIKGNISGSGRIYHLPGQADYDRTRISPDKGERWFCTEAEARAAGWRRARR